MFAIFDGVPSSPGQALDLARHRLSLVGLLSGALDALAESWFQKTERQVSGEVLRNACSPKDTWALQLLIAHRTSSSSGVLV